MGFRERQCACSFRVICQCVSNKIVIPRLAREFGVTRFLNLDDSSSSESVEIGDVTEEVINHARKMNLEWLVMIFKNCRS
ncbi:hypothetical protein TNCV_2799751 [Trichonephila clavipes]|nr:hypothetical protein TNCV_2799751 [Trichonephila clavipes]